MEVILKKRSYLFKKNVKNKIMEEDGKKLRRDMGVEPVRAPRPQSPITEIPVEYEYVHSPSHYNTSTKETWEMMLDIWGKDKFITFCEMNAFKYRMRLGTKPGEEVSRELDKIKWYENKVKEVKDGK